jgi:hypothetical protein
MLCRCRRPWIPAFGGMTTSNATTFNNIDVHPRRRSSAFDYA